MPDVTLPEEPLCRYEKTTRPGRKSEVVERIVDVAKEIDADLIIMASDGRDGVLDALQGSWSERVLRETPAPLAIVPEY
jgi:nucleotide-binding universal stress UspA family protein